MNNQSISLKGTDFIIDIGRRSGRMERLDISIADLGQWNTIPGRIEVVDELQQACYRDCKDTCKVTTVQKKDPNCVVVTKRFHGAVFTVREEWMVTDDEVCWNVTVVLDSGEAQRSIRIRQFIPYPTNEPYRWNVWTAQQHFPKELVKVAQTSMVYGDICCGTVIPLLALYSERKEMGMSIAKPFGLKIPRWTMIFDGYRGGGVAIESGYMKLSNDHSAETALLLHPYAGGCWRPALGYLVQKYPSYFKAGLADASERLDGGFLIGNPSTTETQMKVAKTYNAKAAEIHHHYRYYGHYFPDHGTWHTIEGNPVREAIRKNVRSVKAIRQAVRKFNSHQIEPLLYIQLAGDGYRTYVEKKFPESIALNTDGQHMGQDYYNVWMMNSDLSLPFGKFIHEELERFFRLYPEAGGLFWDQPCYDDIDSAHHDGLTMMDNKPMYRLAFCYEAHRDYMVGEAHKRNMIVSANGPLYIELSEGLDQIMAEGVSWIADIVQYECVARPMLFYHYFKDADDVEEMFQKCLLAGATGYTVPDSLLQPDLELLFRSYTPLVRLLSGRTWLFEPRPLELPRRVDGNIFSKEDGSLYVTLVSKGQSLLEKPMPKKLTFKVRSTAVHHIRSVSCWGPSGKETTISYQPIDERTICITIPEHMVASVVEIRIDNA
jgi:hypothetical protein